MQVEKASQKQMHLIEKVACSWIWYSKDEKSREVWNMLLQKLSVF